MLSDVDVQSFQYSTLKIAEILLRKNTDHGCCCSETTIFFENHAICITFETLLNRFTVSMIIVEGSKDVKPGILS